MTIAFPQSVEDPGRRLFGLSVGVFFLGGFLTSIVSLLVPRLRLTMGFGYAEASIVQLAFHSSYLLFALPITFALVRLGYMRAIAIGLGVMTVACLGFALALGSRRFALLLLALLLLSAGITFLQIAANTVVTVVGSPAGAASRLTLLQGFNSVGTVAGPVIGAGFILGAGGGGGAIASPDIPFLLSALPLAALALAFLRWRDLLPRAAAAQPAPRELRNIVRDRPLFTGTAAMFAYVGAEVTIGSLLTSYLMLPTTLGAGAVTAGRMVGLYWGSAMIGRFAGAYALARIRPARLLLAVALGAVALTLAATTLHGAVAAAALIVVGLMNAVMYPTIYALALPADAARAPIASMWLCMAVVGGAVVPVLTGVAADAVGLARAIALPALCYAGIALFARDRDRDRVRDRVTR